MSRDVDSGIHCVIILTRLVPRYSRTDSCGMRTGNGANLTSLDVSTLNASVSQLAKRPMAHMLMCCYSLVPRLSPSSLVPRLSPSLYFQHEATFWERKTNQHGLSPNGENFSVNP